MSRRDGSCWRHPAQRAAGVCADCLKERLSALSPSAEGSAQPRRSSCSDRTSTFGFVALDRRKDSSDINRLGSGDHGLIRGQKALSPLFSEAYLRRSKSWSHWEGGGSVGGGCPRQHWNNNGFAGRKSDAVLDDWTRQRFFSIFAKDQQQKEAHVLATSSNNRGTPQHFRYELSKSASSKERAGHTLLRSKGATELNSNHTILENGSMEEGLSTEEAAAAKKPRRTPAWLSSLLQLAFRKPKARPEAASDKKKEMGTSKVGSTNITGMFNKSKKAGEKQSKNAVKQANAKAATLDQAAEKQNVAGDDKQRFLNCKAPKQCTPSENSSWVRTISSPLRLFKHGQQQQRRKNGTEELQPARLSCSEEKSSWSIPSSTELKRLHATPAYTAYYRDYGAWSLSSSPVPNGRWNNHGRAKQPWENRDISHASSSPYRVGSSTWNFYLTPLRPVKATPSSKHRY